MAQIFANNAISTLASPLGISDTAMSIAPGTGSRWPVIAAPDFAFTTLEDAEGNIEIVKVTAHADASTTLTIERAQQGTAARAYSIGDLVELRLTRQEMAAWEADIDDLEATRSRHAGQVYTGAHDFGAASGVTLPAATSIGGVSEAEIATLDGVTSNVQAQIDAANAARVAGDADLETRKADTNGETYTGTHDFTGATLRAATKPYGTSGTEVATVEYVNQAAFQQALPGQAGSNGGVLGTNGTAAAWVSGVGNAGKVLTTDASNAAWSDIKTVNGQQVLGPGNIDTYPVQAGNAGKVLTTNGEGVSWEWGVTHQPLLAMGII